MCTRLLAPAISKKKEQLINEHVMLHMFYFQLAWLRSEPYIVVPMTSLPCPSFLLVRWLDDVMLSVISEKTFRQGGRLYVGAILQFKWCGKKLYDGEVLAKSGKNT